ncbi:muscarinic acetylcholine receptor M3-like [Clytia hemisphaerica]|uniref:muscarinic acetylcholine receptor M3-like n=1 Tax=Clytia hemisphaerica TaxID=252671 RepID=UPI0034D3B85D
MNFTVRQFDQTMTEGERSILITVNIFIALVGIPGNLFILVFFIRSEKYRESSYRYFLLHLAVSDLLTCCLIPLTKIPVLFTRGRWTTGHFSCQFLYPLTWMSVANSAWILCGLCWDRYKSISKPLDGRLTKKQITIYCVVGWVVSFTIYGPFYFITRVEDGFCDRFFFGEERSYTTYIDLAKDIFKGYLPSSTMITFLINMQMSLKQRRKELSGRLRVDKDHRVFQRMQKNSKFVTLTTVLFVGCLLPSTMLNTTVNILRYVPRYEHDLVLYERFDRVLGWLWGLTYVNSAINCFIYAGSFKDFQQFIVVSLKGFFYCHLFTKR